MVALIMALKFYLGTNLCYFINDSSLFQLGKPINHNGGVMNINSDEMYEKFKDDNFAEAKPVSQIPALVQLQAETTGSNYHTMINDALKQFMQGQTLVDVVRQTIQQELRHH